MKEKEKMKEKKKQKNKKKNRKKRKKLVPRGTSDAIISSSFIVPLFLLSFDDFLALKLAKFVVRKLLGTDLRTDRRTDGRTDGQTDATSYRNALSHLERKKREEKEYGDEKNEQEEQVKI